MAWRDLLGRIDCPHCGHPAGMKITEDRAGKPFGNCDVKCHGQLRIGDKDNYRVGLFYARYPHVARCGQNPVTVTGEENPVTVTEKKKEIVHGAAAATTKPHGGQVSVTVPARVAKSSFASALDLLTGVKNT